MPQSKLPAYVLKNCSLVAGGTNRIGNCSEITLPVLEKTTEEFRNSGMIKPRLVSMGYEATEMSFKDTALDPDLLRLFVTPGPDQDIIAYGYLESEDGRVHDARVEMVCDLTGVDFGSWTPGGKAETEFTSTVHSTTLFIDGEEVLHIDDFSIRIGGVERQPRMRRALRMV